MKYYVLYNPVCYYGQGEKEAYKISGHLYSDILDFYDMTKIEDYRALISGFEEDSRIVICGGDGTLHRFANDTRSIEIRQEIYYYATGAGTDFMTDIGGKRMDPPVNITKYMRNLPVATVNGKEYVFINNVGMGLDGYCTHEADKQLAAGVQNVNFSKIAILGILGRFKRFNISVTVNGNTRTFKRVLISTTMQGRYYGGGMMPTPDQNRLNSDHHVSVIVMFNCRIINTFMAFPGFFKGTHLNHHNICKAFTGHEVRVVADRPMMVQLDGETIPDVTEYSIRTT